MEDTTQNCPRITVTAHSMPHKHERRAEDVPVIEGDDTLTSLVADSYGSSTMYLFESSYFRTVAVIAGHEQAAWNYLADFGVLDELQIAEDEAREAEGQGQFFIRLGNASEPFDIDGSTTIVSTFDIEDIEHFHTELKFGRDGWMHLWANNRHNDRPPYRDFFLQIGDDLEVMEYWSPSNQINDDEHAEMLKKSALHALIANNC